jgi:polysaccharide deacetylase family protein (PEP-CTERM system associated)
MNPAGALDIFSIDVEDWFHIHGVPSAGGMKDWSALESRVERNFKKLLDLLDDRNAKATCFILGWVAEHHPNVVREAQRRGHEVASHGYGHQLVAHQTRAEFAADIRKSKNLLEQLAGVAVQGYRAPGFSITKDSYWAFDELVQAGFRYDSSIFPAGRDNGGITGAVKEPHQLETPSGKIWEFPISVARFFGKDLCFFGGGYLRLFPYSLIREMSEQVSRSGLPVIYYIHPREIDLSHPRMEVGPLKRFKSYVNLGTTESKLKGILRDRTVMPFSDWLAAQPAAATGEAKPARRP